VFSGLDSSVAGEIEGAFAQAGHVIVSNSRNYRMEADVPLLIPEVNADHLALLEAQGARGWKGRIVTNPNCVVVVLRDGAGAAAAVRLKTSIITTLQAISGAGYPGVPSWDILGNVIPFIGGGEEEKIETETNKILGALRTARREPSADGQRRGRRACRCTTATPDRFRSRSSSSPTPRRSIARGIVPRQAAGARAAVGAAQPIVYLTEPNRPQPALDANRDGGMTVTVGRLRRCPVLDYKFVALGHNTIRGAAGAAILERRADARGGCWTRAYRTVPTQGRVSVMKFGGTSVADPDAINRLIGIVRQQQAKTKSAPVVVVSALAGVTDKLVALAQLAEDGASEAAAAQVRALLERHLSVASAVTSTSRPKRPGRCSARARRVERHGARAVGAP
jgi:aspartate-semialdehyde dehydrogenase